MKLRSKLFLTSAACMAFFVSPAMAQDTTITTKTYVHQKELPDTKKTDFSAFDMNGDNILSMEEVGEKLFYLFDTDGNEVIDNIEFDHKNVMTIIPMEKETFTYVDWQGDGQADVASFDKEVFFEQSGLMRFDENMDGLSPADFIEKTLLELDIDKSKVIEIDEWKQAYEASTRPAVADQERYN